MWILLTKKLSTEPSPPMMSIHWSTAWPNMTFYKIAIEHVRSFNDLANENIPEQYDTFIPSAWGKEQRWDKARAITYKGERIRVFPSEFDVITPEYMSELCLGDSPSYELVLSDINEIDIISKKRLKETDDLLVKDAAVIDGASEDQAILTAMGVDITLPDAEFPPVGWYRCKKEYAQIFCNEWEMNE